MSYSTSPKSRSGEFHVAWATEGIEGTCETTTEAAGKIGWENVGGNEGAVTEGL